MSLLSVAEFGDFASTAAAYSTAQKQAFLDAASTAVERYCRRSFDYASYDEQYTGEGHPDLRLNQYPVDPTVPVTVNIDRTYTFAASTVLNQNTDFILFPEQGILRLLTSNMGWWTAYGGIGGMAQWGYNGLLNGSQIAWPKWPLSIKVSYSAGYVDLPSDLKMAIASVAIFGLRSVDFGGMTSTSVNYIDVSSGGLQFMTENLARGAVPALASTREILQSYRKPDMPVSTLIR